MANKDTNVGHWRSHLPPSTVQLNRLSGMSVAQRSVYGERLGEDTIVPTSGITSIAKYDGCDWGMDGTGKSVWSQSDVQSSYVNEARYILYAQR